MKNNFFKTHSENIKKFNNGECVNAYEFLGAHYKDDYTEFVLWAPHATEVRLIGSFNSWNGKNYQMERYKDFWYIKVDNAKIGDTYKYEIYNGQNILVKSDPFAFWSALRPDTASSIYSLENDLNIVTNLENINEDVLNIYEIHIGSFITNNDGTFLNYKELAPKLTNYLIEMGYNCVEFMPLCEYPFDASWGYQITGFYSLTSRYGSPDDFKYLIQMLHSANIRVIIDWVPGHFCRDSHGLFQFDGQALYENEHAIIADNPCWGTTNFDFSKPQVNSFLISNAVFWLKEYGIDGIRVDAVANILYSNFGKNDNPLLKNKYGNFENIDGILFLKRLNNTISELFPNVIMIAEDSTDWPYVTKPVEIGGLGFDYKWNMGWMNDTLSYMKLDPIYRSYEHDKLTFPMCYAFNEKFILPISHDEVVHGKCSMLEKMPGFRFDKFAQLREFLVYMYVIPGKKLIFMGNEFGHSLEWRHYQQLEWNLLEYDEYSGMKRFTSDINHLYLNNSSFKSDLCGWEGFKWCNANDNDRSMLSFVRFSPDKEEFLVFVINFTPVKYDDFLIGVPVFCDYQEIINSDNIIYGGKNALNRGLIIPKVCEVGEMPFSISLNIPAFGGIILKPLIIRKED